MKRKRDLVFLILIVLLAFQISHAQEKKLDPFTISYASVSGTRGPLWIFNAGAGFPSEWGAQAFAASGRAVDFHADPGPVTEAALNRWLLARPVRP